jgi:hypothetical protein
MGLDTAVFESQSRRLPWHGNSSASIHVSGEPRQQQQQAAAVMWPAASSASAYKRAAGAAKERAVLPYLHAQHLSVPSSWALDKYSATKPRVLASGSKATLRAAGGVKPHWMSHMQRGVPASVRDQAVRLHWQGAAVQSRRG